MAAKINSKAKGARGERELANKLKEYGYENCHRTQQFCGKAGDSDVTGLDHIHIEVKRVEKLNIDNAMAQAISDSKELVFPTVFHRKDHKDWLVTMRLDDWINLYKSYENAKADGGT